MNEIDNLLEEAELSIKVRHERLLRFIYLVGYKQDKIPDRQLDILIEYFEKLK